MKGLRILLVLLLLGGAALAARRYDPYFWAFWVLVLLVLFQPEVRRGLGQVSRLLHGVLGSGRQEAGHVIDDLVEAVHSLAAKRVGALIVAAGCFLPLSRNPELGRKLGTRHRAALGLSEETDAVVLVVSEESGRISLAVAGQMESPLDRGVLRRRLTDLWAGGAAPARGSLLDGLLRRWGIAKKSERHEGA
jgi:DNA integrity scanning protein DisA with diadenylate cyclase activity